MTTCFRCGGAVPDGTGAWCRWNPLGLAPDGVTYCAGCWRTIGGGR